MKIAIDMVCTNLGSGTKTYISSLCDQILKNYNQDPIIYIFITDKLNKELNLSNQNKIKVILKPNFLTITICRLLWMQFILPLELRSKNIKKLFSPMNFIPLMCKLLNIKTILANHTVLPWVNLSKIPGNNLRNAFMKFLMSKSIEFCDFLILDSYYAKEIILKNFNIKTNKLNVIYLGIDYDNVKKQKNKIKCFDYNKEYIISVLSCTKYHNIINIIKGFEISLDKLNYKYNLVFVMQILDKEYYNEILDYIKKNKKIKNKIIILSNLDRKYLSELYKNAGLYIFSSYSEVFGYTSLEAMACNCPVLISKTSALIEVNDGASEFFDPDDVIEISKKIELIIRNKEISEDLKNKGEKHVKKFSNKKCSQKTLELIVNV
jgi:glycosyltransferase involved in cell wall biosynthesis